MSIRLRRRSFVTGSAVALAGCGRTKEAPPMGALPVASQVASQHGAAPVTSAAVSRTTSEVPRRPLGKTGVTVSMVGLGGFHLGLPKERAESVRIIRSAIDRGIDFMDNCWDYNGGASEERMGAALQDGYRQRVFLMTKLDGRTREAAAAQLDQSLKRLRTDVIDLVQIHEVIRPTDPARCFAEGGCIEALLAAKQAGKLRFIGFTGHKDPDIHLAMLEAADAHGFAFDTVQMPLNVMDAHYRSFEKKVLPVLVEKGIGVIGMKSLGSGMILESKVVGAVECLHYAMNLPTSVVVTGCDSMGVLDQAVAAARSFEAMAPSQVAALLGKTRDLAQGGRFERFKTSTMFDGTQHNPRWLEGATI